MIYKDRVYGRFRIEEPVISDLIKSKPIQRLKNIEQGGYIPLYYNPKSFPLNKISHSRFEHSLGVYLLLRKFKASLEEQIAGLIHDASHAAFSHCIDYVLDEGSQKEHNHQDNIFDDFIRKTEIIKILKKHGFNPNFILNDKNFPLKEKQLPDLCADRIDYSLRTALIFKEAARKKIDYLLDNLIAKNNKWFFRNFKSAEKYAELFLKMNRLYYAGFSSAVMFGAVGDTLRYALSKGYISKKDLYSTDKEVVDKIKKYLRRDKKLSLLFDRMNGKIGVENDRKRHNTPIFCKSRVVDPLCEHKGTIARVSEISKKWKEIVKKELKPKEYFIKFEK